MKVPSSSNVRNFSSDMCGDHVPRSVSFDVEKQRNISPITADPLLCITPEKGDLKKSFERLKGDSDESKLNGTATQRVRFDHTVEVCELSPSDELSSKQRVTNNVTLERNNVFEDDVECRVLSYRTNEDDNYDDISNDYNLHGSAYNIRLFSSQNSSHDSIAKKARPVSVQKDLGENEYSSVVENIYAQPELNSLLKIGKGMKSLREADADPLKLVSEKLATSNKVRQTIEEKASLKLNHQNDVFGRLVSVDVGEDDIKLPVLQKSIPHSKLSNVINEDVSEEVPDLMEFFSAELQKESTSLTVEDVLDDGGQLRTAPMLSVFDIYRHIRAWNIS